MDSIRPESNCCFLIGPCPQCFRHDSTFNLEEAERVLNDQELMRLHVETLFRHDARGRMISANEPQGGEAPRFFLGRTVHGNVWRFRCDLDENLVQELESACSAEPFGDEPLLSQNDTTRYAELLARSAAIERRWVGPAYCVPATMTARSEAVRITEQNFHILHPLLDGWLGDVTLCQPMLVAVSDGRAVSVCCSVRRTAMAHEAGVETAQEFRGRGYATQAVAAWAGAVRCMGCIPLYSTSRENTASQALARKLGLRRFGTDLHIT